MYDVFVCEYFLKQKKIREEEEEIILYGLRKQPSFHLYRITYSIQETILDRCAR